MLKARLPRLKRRRHAEDRLAVLDRHHPPRRERLAVADALDVVNDRPAHVAAAQEIPVERVHLPLARHRLLRRRQRLSQHLTAEHRAPAEVLALPAKQRVLEPLETKEAQELGEDGSHARAMGSTARA
jgi:hypothetical protein